MRFLEQVPNHEVLAHQRLKRPDYPPAGIALETRADPHWSELSAYLVELEQADAADIFLYWEYRTLLRGWGQCACKDVRPQICHGEPAWQKSPLSAMEAQRASRSMRSRKPHCTSRRQLLRVTGKNQLDRGWVEIAAIDLAIVSPVTAHNPLLNALHDHQRTAGRHANNIPDA